MTSASIASFVYQYANLRQSGNVMQRKYAKLIILCAIIVLMIVACHNATGYKYEIDQQTCIGCGKCQEACPHNAISFQGDKAVIIQSKCQHCGKCVSVCPEKAIH